MDANANANTELSIEAQLAAFLDSGEFDADLDAVKALEEIESGAEPEAAAESEASESPKVEAGEPAETQDEDIMALLDALEDGKVKHEEEKAAEAAEKPAPAKKEASESVSKGESKKASKPKSEASEEKKKAPRITTAGMIPSEAFVHKFGSDLEQYRKFDSDTDLAARKVELETACDALAKKVKEKAINLQDFNVRGAQLSVYTYIALELLIKEGSMNTADLRAAYMSNPDKPYSIGTSSSQAGQMFSLLPAFGIAKLTGRSEMELVEDHVIVKKFKDLYMK